MLELNGDNRDLQSQRSNTDSTYSKSFMFNKDPSKALRTTKYLKNMQLQVIAQVLNAKMINIRDHLKIYHTSDIPEATND